MRRLMLCAVLLLLGAALVFAGGGKGEAPTAAAGAPLVIDAFVIQNAEYPEVGPDLNKLTAFLMDKFKVTFKFVVAPDEGAEELKSVLLASGDYPSIFFHGRFSKSDRQKYGQLGVLVALNDLVRKYAPNIQKTLAKDKVYAAGNTAPDGKIYGLAGAELCWHCQYVPKYWINTVWLDKLGLKMPETTADLERVLEAFKTRDPNGNGKADEVPLSGAVNTWYGQPQDFLLTPFVYTDTDHYLYAVNGKVALAAATPEFREGLRYINRLYKKGLIDPQAFTQNEEQFKVIANDPEIVILGSFAVGHLGIGPDIGMGAGTTYDPGATWVQYQAMPPLEGPTGLRQSIYRAPEFGEANFAVTNKSSAAVTQRALEMMDWFFTLEGGITAMFGPRGYQWDWPEQGALGMRGKPAVFQTHFDRADPKYTPTFEPPFYLDMDTFIGWAQDQDMTIPTGYERFLTVATDMYAKYTPKETVPSEFWMPEDVADAYAQHRTEFTAFINQNAAQFIIGQKSIDADWDAYLKELRAMGLDEYLSIVQKAYGELKK